MYIKLRQLLEKETYPHSYVHKFIGPLNQEFLAAVDALQSQFAHLDLLVESRQSQKGGYIAFTLTFLAKHAEEIIVLVKATAELPGLKMIL